MINELNEILPLLQQPQVFYPLVFVLGLMVGSFLNVVIYRLPKMMERGWYEQCTEYFANIQAPGEPLLPAAHPTPPFNLCFPLSHCPQCKKTILPWENIPLLSYLFLRGKCSKCHSHISLRYPAIELFTALVSLFLAYHFGLTPAFMASLFLSWLLIALTFIDIDTQLLPDDLTYLGLWAGLLLSLGNVFASPQDAILGAVMGYMVLWTLYWAFKWITKKEGMGYGDFKLLALAGAWLGWQYLLIIVLISSFTGALWGLVQISRGKLHKDHPMPFGPFIALATWLTLIFGEKILTHYLHWVF